MSVCSVREHLLQAKERAGEFSAEAQELDQLLQVTDKKMLEFIKIVLQVGQDSTSRGAEGGCWGHSAALVACMLLHTHRCFVSVGDACARARACVCLYLA